MSRPQKHRNDGRTFPLYCELGTFDLTCGTLCSHLKQRNTRLDDGETFMLRSAFKTAVNALYKQCKDSVYARRYENMPYDDYRQWGYNTGVMKDLRIKWLNATLGVRQWEHRQSIKGDIA